MEEERENREGQGNGEGLVGKGRARRGKRIKAERKGITSAHSHGNLSISVV